MEEGTHQELMALGGRYAQLFTLQAAAYTGEPIDDLLAADEAEARNAADAEPFAERSA